MEKEVAVRCCKNKGMIYLSIPKKDAEGFEHGKQYLITARKVGI